MEAIKTIQINDSKQSTKPIGALQSYSPKVNPKIYKANVMELLKRIRRLANAAPLSVAELELQADDWTDVLIDEVRLEWLPDLYKRAVRNHPNSHLVNVFDILQESQKKKAEIELEKEKSYDVELGTNPISRCTHHDRHINENGEIIAFNFYSEKDETMPCPHCRATDHSKWKADQIARYGEIKPTPITPTDAVMKIMRDSEVRVSQEEGRSIADEYNNLVEKIVDPETAKLMFIKFDEGVNRFKYPHRADVLFKAADIRKKIDDYKNISRTNTFGQSTKNE